MLLNWRRRRNRRLSTAWLRKQRDAIQAPHYRPFLEQLEDRTVPSGLSLLDQGYGQLPLYFIENQGQVDDRVAYYLQGSDTAVYFTSAGATFALTGTSGQTATAETAAAPQRWAVDLDFVGANPDVRPVGEDRTEAVISYFTGTPDQWHPGLPTYGSVVYHDLWPGIDLVWSGAGSKLKYTLIVQPGADPGQIQLAYHGATGVTLTDAGQIDVTTPVGGFQDDAPYAYQEVDGQRVEVASGYALASNSAAEAPVYTFRVGAYDPSRPLVLDPVMLVYAGYIGGDGGGDVGTGIAVDSNGNAYVTGFTGAIDNSFPVTVGPDVTYNGGSRDAFVVKVSADGTALVYAGYIGGAGDDRGYGIAVDSAGNAYVVGETDSDESSFPTKEALDKTFNGGIDVFVAR